MVIQRTVPDSEVSLAGQEGLMGNSGPYRPFEVLPDGASVLHSSPWVSKRSSL